MSDELKRMQELAGVPVNEEKESLNEHYIAGGIVGVGAVNQIPPREKSDYEMAFEHFMTEGEEKEEKKEISEDEIEEAGFEPNIGDGDEGFGDMNYRMEEAEGDGAIDVKTIDKILPKINTKAEYMELLPKIIGLDIAGVTPQAKKSILLKLAKEL